ncbi:hypothetical protein HWV62_19359 [Athelia sp. TMB]|nr:hypothetical protein HWV62_19359 [Athelia sp. TMB]
MSLFIDRAGIPVGLSWGINTPATLASSESSAESQSSSTEFTRDNQELDWRRIPNSYEEICEWAYLNIDDSSQDWRRSYSMVYNDPTSLAEESTLYPVLVRLQGIVKSLDLGVFGSWGGPKTSTITATQHLTLSSPGNADSWAIQLEGLFNLRTMAHGRLARRNKHRMERIPDISDDIHCTRRVFYKLRGDGTDPRSVLRPADDPNNWMHRVASRWRVVEKLPVGRLLSTGEIVNMHPSLLSVGDFVDVTVSFDCMYRGRLGSSVQYRLEGIVQLVAQAAVPSNDEIAGNSDGDTDAMPIRKVKRGLLI